MKSYTKSSMKNDSPKPQNKHFKNRPNYQIQSGSSKSELSSINENVDVDDLVSTTSAISRSQLSSSENNSHSVRKNNRKRNETDQPKLIHYPTILKSGKSHGKKVPDTSIRSTGKCQVHKFLPWLVYYD